MLNDPAAPCNIQLLIYVRVFEIHYIMVRRLLEGVRITCHINMKTILYNMITYLIGFWFDKSMYQVGCQKLSILKRVLKSDRIHQHDI